MTEKTKRHVTLSVVIAGATLVVTSLGALVNGVVDLDRKVGGTTTATDSLFANDSLIFARLERLERRTGVRSRARAGSAKPAPVGLVRRVFRLLF